MQPFTTHTGIAVPLIKETQVPQQLPGDGLHLPAIARIHARPLHDQRNGVQPPLPKLVC